MSQIKATFTGAVVADPEHGQTPTGAQFVKFPVYVNHSKKNKESGEYVKTGDVSKITVTLWGDKTATDIKMGDVVEVTATLVEKEWDKRDGSKGRRIQTDYVESTTVKFTKSGMGVPSLGIGQASTHPSLHAVAPVSNVTELFPNDADAPF